MDLFGAEYELFDEAGSDEAEELTIWYPHIQRGGSVWVTAGAATTSTASAATGVTITPIPVGAAKLASEVPNVTGQNMIVVGGPCANTVAAELLGNPEPCTEGFSEGKALIKLWEHTNGNVAILVAGFTALDTRRAARVMANFGDHALSGTEVEVSGTSLTDVSVKSVS